MNISEEKGLSSLITGMEKTALEQWYKGDPSGFLALSSTDVVYFDPFLERRIDGLEQLTTYYQSAPGTVKIDSYEMINPVVQAGKDMAVLTYNLISRCDQKVFRWNCTEVYRLEKDGTWKIIQTHWSLTKPELK